jgi:hypothetical protein
MKPKYYKGTSAYVDFIIKAAIWTVVIYAAINFVQWLFETLSNL